MDHTPVRRQRSARNSEHASVQTTPMRLSSGRRRSLGPFVEDDVPEKKRRTSFEDCATKRASFNSLIDQAADSLSPPPSVPGSTAGSVGKMHVRSVSSLLAAQRANRQKSGVQHSLVSLPKPAVQSDADAARQCLESARQFVEPPARSTPQIAIKSAGCANSINNQSRQLLITKSGEMGVEFLFDGEMYRAVDEDAFQDVLVKPNMPAPTRTVASLRAVMRHSRQDLDTRSLWLVTNIDKPPDDATAAIHTLECVKSLL